MMDYRRINRRARGELARHGCMWTGPVGQEDLARAWELFYGEVARVLRPAGSTW
ncbi:MAG: hypothetical protein GX496_07690 [Firmicutes bacterium]|nr:hypothetical protein [Bacillota bacterium]